MEVISVLTLKSQNFCKYCFEKIYKNQKNLIGDKKYFFNLEDQVDKPSLLRDEYNIRAFTD